jgi:tetratricopeptide (TPR) repeat protein
MMPPTTEESRMRISIRNRTTARRLAVWTLAALALPFAAAAQDSGPADQMMAEGEANQELSDQSDPMRQARNLYFTGKRQMKSAEKAVAKAEKAGGDERVELAKKAKEDLEGAVQSFTAAIQSGPGYLDAYVALGEALRALGRHEEALKVHSTALARDKKSDENFQGYVVSLVALHRLGNAVALYDQVKAEQPKRAKFVLETLRQFYAARQQDPAGLAQEDLDRLGSWLAEHAKA